MYLKKFHRQKKISKGDFTFLLSSSYFVLQNTKRRVKSIFLGVFLKPPKKIELIKQLCIVDLIQQHVDQLE
jgi:hypothetical protein